MRVYEEYDSPAEKRKAQKGAKLRKATKKALGYILVFDEDGRETFSYGDGSYYSAISALSELMSYGEPGEGPQAIYMGYINTEILTKNCRAISFDEMPKEWQIAFLCKIHDCIRSTWYWPGPFGWAIGASGYNQIRNSGRVLAIRWT